MILGRGSIELHFIGQTTSFAEWTAASCHSHRDATPAAVHSANEVVQMNAARAAGP